MLSRSGARSLALLPWVVSLSAHAAVLAAAMRLLAAGGDGPGPGSPGLTVLALPSDVPAAVVAAPSAGVAGPATRSARRPAPIRQPSAAMRPDAPVVRLPTRMVVETAPPDAHQGIAITPGDPLQAPAAPDVRNPDGADPAHAPAERVSGGTGSVPTTAVGEAPGPTRIALAEPAPMRGPLRAPRYLQTSIPAYPDAARRAGREGLVQLRARIRADGLPDTVLVWRSSGSEDLDAAARQEVGRWRFEPARQGDQAIASWMDIPVRFSLRAEP